MAIDQLVRLFRRGDFLDVPMTGDTTPDAEQAFRARIIRVSGTPAAPCSLVLPAEQGLDYVVWNTSTQTVTVRGTSGTTVDLAPNDIRFLVCDGSGFRGVAGGNASKYTSPPKTGWSWQNQGGATIDESGDAILLTTPAENHYQIRGRTRAFGAAKTVVAAVSGFNVLPAGSSGFPEWGVGWTDGTKLVTISTVLVASGHGYYLEVHKFTDAVTVTVASVFFHPGPNPTWIKLRDDGANRKAYYSPDEGEHWVEIYSEGRTTFLTATSHIFMAGGGGGLATTATLRSWVDS